MIEENEEYIIEEVKVLEVNEIPKIPRRGIGTIIKEAILENKTNAEALEASKAEFPHSKTSLANVSWYRNHLRKMGYQVPTARQLKNMAKAKIAAENVESVENDEIDPLA